VAVVLTATALGSARPTGADEDGLRFETRSVYTLDPAAGAVHVSVDVTATNERPNRYTATSVLQSYLPELGLVVLAEAANLSATRDDGTPLDVTLEPSESPLVSYAVVDVTPNLFFGDSQTFRLVYDLPSLPPRAEGLTRVNAAFGIVIALAEGDPTLASVEVVVPAGYDVEVVGDQLQRTNRSGNTVLTAEAITDPLAFDAVVVARRDEALVRRTVELGDHRIEVGAWPGDDEWADFVAAQVTNGIPTLEALIGRELPADRSGARADGTLQIVETSTPYVYGYAGWYLPFEHVIEIGEDLDAAVVLHELAHLWFNDDLFTDRWVNEGFAEEFASRALERLGQPLTAPEPVDPAVPGAIRLNGWSDPVLVDDESEAREDYGYNTSFAVLRAITDEIGLEKVAAVIDAAADHEIAYRGDRPPERWSSAATWRRFLDLLQEVGGSEQAVDLFTNHVVAPEEASVLAARQAARIVVDELEAAGAGWTAPLELRRAMSDWRFDEATALVADAGEILGVRDRISATVAPLGVEVPAALEDAYEGAVADLDDVARQAEDTQRTADAVAAADAAADRDLGLFGTIGAIGDDPEAIVERAARAFEDGNLDVAARSAAEAIELVDGADERGERRVASALGALLLVGWMVLARRAGTFERHPRGFARLADG
jgi:hypothetical protein